MGRGIDASPPLTSREAARCFTPPGTRQASTRIMGLLGRFFIRGEALPLPGVRSWRGGLSARPGAVRGIAGGDPKTSPALL